MSTEKTGGPAFPFAFSEHERISDGMTLRDYFAAKALAGFLSGHAGDDTSMPNPENAAHRSFEYADAMLKARKA